MGRGLETFATFDEREGGGSDGALAPGQIIDRYEVIDVLGRGASAEVYRVKHTRLETLHALKLLTTLDPKMLDRLLAEGRLLARWNHPHIVRVQDAFEVNGALALLMELITGETLAEHMFARPEGMQLSDVDELFPQILSAVEHAHGADVVHRDLKASNILLDATGEQLVARVSDFGIAKVTHSTIASMLADTRTGMLLGTPAYMAPEQVDHAGDVDARADLFALGVILYEMCAGRRPFDGANVWAVLDSLRRCHYIPLRTRRPEVPERFARAVDACLVRDPDVRVPSVEVLRAVFAGESDWAPVRAVDPPLSPSGPTPRPRLVWMFAAALIAVGALAAVGVALDYKERAEQTLSRATTLEQEVIAREDVTRLERRINELEQTRPAEAIALSRARAVLANESPDASVLARLAARGGASKVIATSHQPHKVAYAPRTGKIAAALLDSRVGIWDVETGELLVSRETGLSHYLLELRFSRDEQLLYLARDVSKIDPDKVQPPRAINVETGETVLMFSDGRITDNFEYVPEKELIVTGTGSEHLQIWDARTAAPLGKIHMPSPMLNYAHHGLVVDPSGEHILFKEHANNRFWFANLEQRRVIKELALDAAFSATMSFQPDSKLAAVAGSGELAVFDTERGEIVRTRRGSNRRRLHLNAEGERVVVDRSPRELELLSWPALEEIAVLRAHEARITDIEGSVDGEHLFSSSSDRSIAIWSSMHGALLGQFFGHGSWVLDLVYAPRDGRADLLISGGRDHTVRTWSLPLSDTISAPPGLERGSIVVSQSRRMFAGKDARGRVWVWGAAHEPTVLGEVSSFGRVFISPDARVVAAESGMSLYTWRVRDGAQLQHLEYPISETLFSRFPDAHSDEAALERMIVLGVTGVEFDAGGMVRSFRNATGAIDARATPFVIQPFRDVWMGRGIWADDTMRQVLFSGRRAGLGSYDLEQNKLTARLDVLHEGIFGVLPLPDSDDVLIGYWGGAVERRDAVTLELKWVADGFADSVTQLEFVDQERALVGVLNGEVLTLDLATGEVEERLTAHEHDIVAVAISESGELFATAGKERVIKIWSLDTLELRGVVSAPGQVRALSLDDERLHVVGINGDYHTWSVHDFVIPSDVLVWSGALTNMRVCQGSERVVAVTPYPPAETIWAPEEFCEE